MAHWFARAFTMSLLIMLAGCSSSSEPPASAGRNQPAAAAPTDAEKNKQVVREFYELAFNQQKPEEAVAKYVGASYRQHNPTAGDGSQAFIDLVKGFTKAFPKLRFDFKRFVAEGDLVAVHSHLVAEPGSRGTAVMDIFRVENGKIVEHWDVLQDVPEKAANDNTMF
jgi:predicted SnoaL-like aldol condensation-catalyzing enzyme